jgi:hypothetical protein
VKLPITGVLAERGYQFDRIEQHVDQHPHLKDRKVVRVVFSNETDTISALVPAHKRMDVVRDSLVRADVIVEAADALNTSMLNGRQKA